jgi:hypothetical protein
LGIKGLAIYRRALSSPGPFIAGPFIAGPLSSTNLPERPGQTCLPPVLRTEHGACAGTPQAETYFALPLFAPPQRPPLLMLSGTKGPAIYRRAIYRRLSS